MHISRRGFLKYCLGSAATLGLPLSVVGRLKEALAQNGSGLPKVVWLAGANCTGCTISLANRIGNDGPTDVVDLLTGYIDLAYHPNLMAAAGDLAVEALHGATADSFILAVEGGIPTAFNGNACMLWTEDGRDVTAQEAVLTLAPKAAAVLSIGTCSSYGGIPAGNPNPTGIRSISDLTGTATINIPGCPTHPDWIVYTIASLLAGEIPPLDEKGRPSALYAQEIHKVCPRKGKGETKLFGDDRCLKELGCKGPRTKADCPSRMWNGKTNWCIGANGICLGCTEDGFPDKFSPFHKVEYSYQTAGNDGGSGGDETPPTNAPLTVARCEWLSEKAELVVEGQAAGGAIVTVYNADTNGGLGAVSADSNGIWKFSQYNPSPIPTKVKVETGDHSLVSAVANLPSEETYQGSITKISKCEWRADRSELKVDVQGTPGTAVTITFASSGAVIGTGTIGTDGRLKFRKTDPSSVPCRVRVAAAGFTLERTVEKAPGDCR